MSRNALMSDLRTLLRKRAARFVDELDQPTLIAAKQRLEQMVALIESVGEYQK